MSALAEVVYREMRKKDRRTLDETGAYTYEMPQNLSMVAERSVSYGTNDIKRKTLSPSVKFPLNFSLIFAITSSKGVFSSIPLTLLLPVSNRYNKKTQNERYQFRRQVRNLIKWYSYISQILRMFDKELPH